MIKINLPLKHEPSSFSEKLLQIAVQIKRWRNKAGMSFLKLSGVKKKISMRNSVVQSSGNCLCSHSDQREDD